MIDKDSLRLAKDLLNDINEKIKRISNILDKVKVDYELDLETIDYSVIGDIKRITQLNVIIKQDLPNFVANSKMEH